MDEELQRIEFRILLPISLNEYRIGHLWTIADWSKQNTGGSEGVEIVVNEPREDNEKRFQFTHKIYHLQSKVPHVVRMLAPSGSLTMHEKSCNAFPSCSTFLSNDYMQDQFVFNVDTVCLKDFGESENVHGISAENWENTQKVVIDIANDPFDLRDYNPEIDPTKVTALKTGQKPLDQNWVQNLKRESNENPDIAYVGIYKLCTYKFKWFGHQKRMEKMIRNECRRFFVQIHRQLFCSIDQWHGLTIDQIRELEVKTKEELDILRMSGEVRGMHVK